MDYLKSGSCRAYLFFISYKHHFSVLCGIFCAHDKVFRDFPNAKPYPGMVFLGFSLNIRKHAHFFLPSSFDRSHASITASIMAMRTAWSSSTLMPLMVVPPGDVTISLNSPVCVP